MDWIFLVGANVGQFCDVTLRMTISAFSLNRPRNSCLHKIERRKIMMKFMKRGRKQIMKLISESFVDMLFRRCNTRDAFSSNNFKLFFCVFMRRINWKIWSKTGYIWILRRTNIQSNMQRKLDAVRVLVMYLELT